MSVDLIQHSYGWSDERVLDLPLRRFRQILASIRLRERQDRKREEVLIEWQTKTVSQFIAATVPVEKKGDINQLLAEAENISLTLEGEQTQKDDTPMEVWLEQGSQRVNNRPGSFERLMSGMPG